MDKWSPEVSPFYIKGLDNMTTTLVMTAGYDPLRDEGLLFAKRLIRYDVELQRYHFDSLVYGFFQKRWMFYILELLNFLVNYEKLSATNRIFW